MVGGRMRCLGRVQHLKSRFGDGLMLDIKLAAMDADELQATVLEHFGDLDPALVTPSELKDK